MKRKLSIAALLLVTVPAFSQFKQSEVVSAGGGYVPAESLSVSYTIGEAAIGTLKAGDLVVVQGFQQGYAVSSGDVEDVLARSISVYPNPVRSFVTIELSGYAQTPSTVKCYDMTGRLVAEELFPDNGRLSLDMVNMPQGAYLIKVVASDGDILNKKIMKY